MLLLLSLLAAPALAVNDPCLDGPEALALRGFTHEVGGGSGANSREALLAARAEARRLLYARICGGKGAGEDLRCDALMAHAEVWLGQVLPSDMLRACATAVLPTAQLDRVTVQVRAIAADLDALARQVGADLAERSVFIEPPTWETGCSAGALGAALTTEVLGRFDAALRQRILTQRPAPGAPARTLRLRLEQRNEQVTVWAELDDGSGAFPERRLVTRFPAELFGLGDKDDQACATDYDLDLVAGGRSGTGGLSTRVEVPSHHGVVCQGEPLRPTVQLSRRALVQVYAVAKDASAVLVWPPEGEDGPIDKGLSLGQKTATPSDGELRLVALAVPADQGFEHTSAWAGPCRVPGEFGPAMYPRGAAVAASTVSVLPSETPGCAPAPVAETVDPLPICGR